MNEETHAIITSIGATAEICAEFNKQLKKNGFSTQEALHLTGIMLAELIQPKSKEEN